MKNIIQGFSGLLKKSGAFIAALVFGAIAFGPIVANATPTPPPPASVVIDTINGVAPTGHCVAGTLVIVMHGVSGSDGGPYSIDIGDGFSTTTASNVVKGSSSSFSNVSVTYTPTDTLGAGSLYVFLYHGSVSGADSHFTRVNQCIPPPTKGILTVSKIVSGGTAVASDFTMQVTGGTTAVTPFPGSTTGTDLQLLTGSYTVGEASSATYTPSVTCVDEDTNTSIANPVALVAGKNYACTITNTFIPPTYGNLQVVKTTDSGDSTFSFNGTNGIGSFQITTNGGTGSYSIGHLDTAKTYMLSESTNPHYTADLSACGSNGTVSVTANATTTCTIANAYHNTVPTAIDDSYSTAEDTTLNVAANGVLGNDTDAEADTLTAAVVTPTTHGALTLNADGSFSYVPDANYNGTDTFTYQANDSVGNSNTATVTITVTPVNDAPVANDDTYNTNEDTPVTTGSVLTNDTDVDGDTLSVATADSASVHGGTVIDNHDGTFTYTPATDFNGTDTFNYTVTDGSLTDTAVVTIVVDSQNDAPVAHADAYNTDEDTALNVSAGTGVLANDTDVDGDTLSAVLDTDVSHGTLSLNNDGSFDYTPDADFNGTDSFAYHAEDASSPSGVVTVTITVNPVNDAPVAQDQSVGTAQNLPVSSVLVGTDVDGDSLSYSVTTDPTNGTLSFFNSATGAFTYTPNSNFSGSDSFQFKANDGTADSNIATVSIDVSSSPENTPTLCSDGIDNDNDGLIDLADPDCAQFIPRLTLVKQVVGSDTSATSWTLTASSTGTKISGVTGDEGITDAQVTAGTYVISESGPGHFAASTSCVLNGNQENPISGTVIALAVGDSAICTITNTFTQYSSDVSVTKAVDNSSPKAGQQVVYTLTASNAGPDDAAGVVVNDTLPSNLTYVSDDSSGAYSSGVWTIGNLANGASATLHITAKVNSNVDSGTTIVNTASITSSYSDSNSDNNTGSVSLTVPSSGGGGGGGGGCAAGFTFDPTTAKCVPNGQVLGASTGQVLGVSCGLYMDQHLRRGGAKNNPDQVTKLQQFLNKYGYGNFTPTGFFGPLTEAGVKAFQAKYSDEILKPWNLSAPTGLAYLTTIRQLNLIECPDLTIAVPELVPWSQNPNAQ